MEEREPIFVEDMDVETDDHAKCAVVDMLSGSVEKIGMSCFQC